MKSERARAQPRHADIARTIRFPSSLRGRIVNDAERCGRSFEVDIAPPPSEILSLAASSLAGISDSEIQRITRRLNENDGR